MDTQAVGTWGDAFGHDGPAAGLTSFGVDWSGNLVMGIMCAELMCFQGANGPPPAIVSGYPITNQAALANIFGVGNTLLNYNLTVGGPLYFTQNYNGQLVCGAGEQMVRIIIAK
jgi:hypothetical protein